MKAFLLLLLPALISAQWGESTPVPTTHEECQAELDRMAKCVPNEDIFDRIEWFAYSNVTENLSLIDEIETILDCFGELKCEFSKLIESYFGNYGWILSQLHEELETCVIDNGLLSQLYYTCRKPIIIVEGPPPVNSDSERCDLSYFISCSMKELRKHPEECSREQRNLFYKVLKALKASCLIEKQVEAGAEKNDDDSVEVFRRKILKV